MYRINVSKNVFTKMHSCVCSVLLFQKIQISEKQMSAKCFAFKSAMSTGYLLMS